MGEVSPLHEGRSALQARDLAGLATAPALRPPAARLRPAHPASTSSSELDVLQAAFRAAGGKWSTFIIWAKHTFTLGRSNDQRLYELILYGWSEGAMRHWCGDRDQSDVWQIKKPHKNDLRSTMDDTGQRAASVITVCCHHRLRKIGGANPKWAVRAFSRSNVGPAGRPGPLARPTATDCLSFFADPACPVETVCSSLVATAAKESFHRRHAVVRSPPMAAFRQRAAWHTRNLRQPRVAYSRKSFLTRSNSSVRSTGRLIKSSAPAFLASILAPLSCRPLTMMIGMFLVARSPLSLADTW